MTAVTVVLAIIVALALLGLSMSIRVVQQYEASCSVSGEWSA